MSYVGQVNQSGDYHGYGHYVWEDGSSYTGYWEDGEFHGKGTYIWPDGDKYIGDWVKGKRTGKGTFLWVNSDIYQGDFLNGKRHGEGTQWHADGNKYQGQWCDGERQGQGLFFIAASKAIYDVSWVKGQAVGYGRFMTVDRDIYEGYFLNGKRHGEGTFTWSDGSRIAGFWENGVRDDSRVKDLPPKIPDWSPPESFLNARPEPFSNYSPVPPPGWDSGGIVNRPSVKSKSSTATLTSPVRSTRSSNSLNTKDTYMPEWQKKVLEKKQNQQQFNEKQIHHDDHKEKTVSQVQLPEWQIKVLQKKQQEEQRRLQEEEQKRQEQEKLRILQEEQKRKEEEIRKMEEQKWKEEEQLRMMEEQKKKEEEKLKLQEEENKKLLLMEKLLEEQIVQQQYKHLNSDDIFRTQESNNNEGKLKASSSLQEIPTTKSDKTLDKTENKISPKTDADPLSFISPLGIMAARTFKKKLSSFTSTVNSVPIDKRALGIDKVVKSIRSNSPFRNKKNTMDPIPSVYKTLSSESEDDILPEDLELNGLKLDSASVYNNSNVNGANPSKSVSKDGKRLNSSNGRLNRKAHYFSNVPVGTDTETIDLNIPDLQSDIEDDGIDIESLDKIHEIGDIPEVDEIDDIDLDSIDIKPMSLPTHSKTSSLSSSHTLSSIRPHSPPPSGFVRSSVSRASERNKMMLGVSRNMTVPRNFTESDIPVMRLQKQITLPENLDDTLSRLKKENNFDTDLNSKEYIPRPSIQSSHRPSKQHAGHLTRFFDGLKVDLSEFNLNDV